jgi:hypothetical protein
MEKQLGLWQGSFDCLFVRRQQASQAATVRFSLKKKIFFLLAVLTFDEYMII